MEQFAIRENGYKDFIRGRRPINLCMAGFTLIVLFAVFYNRDFKLPENKFPMVIGILLVIVIVLVMWENAEKRSKEIFESFSITLEDQLITREQYDTPTVSMLRHEVIEITKDQHGVITITGDSPVNVIKIPAQIEETNKLELQLNGILPIIFKSKPLFTFKDLGGIAIVLTALGVVQHSDNKAAIVAASAILIFAMAYSIHQNQRDRNLNYYAKRGSWHILLMAYPLFKMIYEKLF